VQQVVVVCGLTEQPIDWEAPDGRIRHKLRSAVRERSGSLNADY
jgi:hypothetical protein